jgi:hypothetical protein
VTRVVGSSPELGVELSQHRFVSILFACRQKREAHSLKTGTVSPSAIQTRGIVPIRFPSSAPNLRRHCSRNFDAVFLHDHGVTDVDRVVVPFRVLGAQADAAVADILIPE